MFNLRAALPAEHGGQLVDRFNFHPGTGAASIQRVIVGVEPGRQHVGGAGDRMGWREHLAGIKWMKIREILLQAVGHLFKNTECRGKIQGICLVGGRQS